ncbi:MAG: bifunctional (p)ppGpp synthetase/guanosine-3',5'-bis(diphosphate) 3'-pyrophosphohydrolase [Clostridiales bacterium]|nr:bifunctional (p)ppGpp synthetase/guanosine-3',5'-bis(diphosphate) 3'-pyrophosphohydrolase [Clostridiales bacterium]
MFEKVDARFEYIKQSFKKNKLHTKKVERAYLLAKELHKNQIRKDGQPYISHPVEVAIILTDLNFDDDVICAGLLHDVIEDCGYSLQDIRQNFNDKIAELVDAVSAIESEKYKYNVEAIFENEDFVKVSAEEQTFNKLIAFGKRNPLAFCIKFADRLHNLRSIGIFERSKQLAKVRETEQWILPIAKIINAGYFYTLLTNECFKIVYNTGDCLFFKHYDEYHNANKLNVENFVTNLKIAFSGNGINEIYCNDILEYDVYNKLASLIKIKDIRFLSQGKIIKVPNYKVYLFHDKKDIKSIVNDFILKMQNKMQSIAKIIDAKLDEINKKAYFIIEDNYRNKFNLYIMTRQEYIKQTIGTLDGQINNFINDDITHTIATEYIKVITRSGEVMYMPKDSTALDFAFKIHREIGFGFKYAIINRNKNKFPPYTKLNDGDQISIFYDRDNDNNIINVAELKWLAYVNNDLSKKFLIKYFEKKISL